MTVRELIEELERMRAHDHLPVYLGVRGIEYPVEGLVERRAMTGVGVSTGDKPLRVVVS